MPRQFQDTATPRDIEPFDPFRDLTPIQRARYYEGVCVACGGQPLVNAGRRNAAKHLVCSGCLESIRLHIEAGFVASAFTAPTSAEDRYVSRTW